MANPQVNPISSTKIRYLNRREAAEHYRLSRETLDQLRWSGSQNPPWVQFSTRTIRYPIRDEG